jgi:hypothetical protein
MVIIIRKPPKKPEYDVCPAKKLSAEAIKLWPVASETFMGLSRGPPDEDDPESSVEYSFDHPMSRYRTRNITRPSLGRSRPIESWLFQWEEGQPCCRCSLQVPGSLRELKQTDIERSLRYNSPDCRVAEKEE